MIGIVCTHIDDLLYSGTDKFHKNVIEKVKQRYVIGSVEDTAMTFTGWQLKQTEEGIRLSQETYPRRLRVQRPQVRRLSNKSSSQRGSEEEARAQVH